SETRTSYMFTPMEVKAEEEEMESKTPPLVSEAGPSRSPPQPIRTQASTPSFKR
ncbi:unnamed protein product, partial [Ilex paraguariensis]